MSESLRMWVEISFNVVYLLAIWALVGQMIQRRAAVAPADKAAAQRITAAFALLALGDTGHVGFRVLAYALGGLERTVRILGSDVGLVGIGALATATTVTFFYVLALGVWQARFRNAGARYGVFGGVLLAAALIRLMVMALPGNDWNAVTPPLGPSLARNAPLVVQGLGVAYLILRDARRSHDRPFTWIGVAILVSYACYTPVILFVQAAPMVGMLMIPKTLAYLAIALIAYRALWQAAPIAQPATAPAAN